MRQLNGGGELGPNKQCIRSAQATIKTHCFVSNYFLRCELLSRDTGCGGFPSKFGFLSDGHNWPAIGSEAKKSTAHCFYDYLSMQFGAC